MAKVTCNCLIFLLMILSHELLFIEGRSLGRSSGLKKKSTMWTLLSSDGKSFNAVALRNDVATASQHPTRSMEGLPDAFRPTNPGHSPGIGHDIKN
ncbi:hypothetical protein SLA2020_478850 [Shorea laevis]